MARARANMARSSYDTVVNFMSVTKKNRISILKRPWTLRCHSSPCSMCMQVCSGIMLLARLSCFFILAVVSSVVNSQHIDHAAFEQKTDHGFSPVNYIL